MTGRPRRPAADSPEEIRARTVRRALDQAVDAFVADLDPQAFEERPLWPGAEQAWGVSREPLPIPAIQAALVVAQQARQLEREAIAHARGRGESWTEIGKALGDEFARAAKNAGMRLGLAAWRYAVHRVAPGEEVPWRPSWEHEVARWRCWTCGQHIEEWHPDNGSDAERGHLPGCARRKDRAR